MMGSTFHVRYSSVKPEDIGLYWFGIFMSMCERVRKKRANQCVRARAARRAKNPLGHSHWLGKRHKPETLRKMSLSRMGRNNPNWRGGRWVESLDMLREHLRCLSVYKQWRKAVFERDNYTCRVCGKRGSNTYLQAHHITPFIELATRYNIVTIEQAVKCQALWDVDNGLTMCVPCHRKTDNYGSKVRGKTLKIESNP